jgi:hypothetical protein
MSYHLINLTLLLGLVLLSQPTAHAGEVFKCVENGKTSFTPAPQQGANCHPLSIDTTPTPAVPEYETDYNPRITSEQAEDRALDARYRELIRNDPDALRRKENEEIARDLSKEPVIVRPPYQYQRGRMYFPR